jgi:hypothetical protein
MFGLIADRFRSISLPIAKRLEENVIAVMKSGGVNTYDMVRELSKSNNKSFKTNEMLLRRFLQNKNMQIDDEWWRKHINLIFDLLEERRLILGGDKIQINVDYTTSEDDFLILSASILISEDKSITLYFSVRNYPKKKDSMSQVKMEEAFIKRLRHILSKKYRYIITADRGFGNDRFMKLCEDNGFDFVLRLQRNLNIIKDNTITNIKNITINNKFEAKVPSWNNVKRYFTIKASEEENNPNSNAKTIWYLIGNNKELDAFEIYSKRFKIEKIYQDLKSSGYDIEKTKIKKYDRFKRLLYIATLAHCLTCILGDIIQKTKNNIKKNSTDFEILNLKLILAVSSLDIKLCPYTLGNPLNYFINISNMDLYETNQVL